MTNNMEFTARYTNEGMGLSNNKSLGYLWKQFLER